MSAPPVGVGGGVFEGGEVGSSAALPVGVGVAGGADSKGAGVRSVSTGWSTPPVGGEGTGVLVPGVGMPAGAGVGKGVRLLHDGNKSGHACPFSCPAKHPTYFTYSSISRQS